MSITRRNLLLSGALLAGADYIAERALATDAIA